VHKYHRLRSWITVIYLKTSIVHIFYLALIINQSSEIESQNHRLLIPILSRCSSHNHQFIHITILSCYFSWTYLFVHIELKKFIFNGEISSVRLENIRSFMPDHSTCRFLISAHIITVPYLKYDKCGQSLLVTMIVQSQEIVTDHDWVTKSRWSRDR